MERGLVDFVISTGANLYHDLHHALNFTLHRGSPFLDDVELHAQGIIRIYDVLFPADVLLETDAYIRDFLVREGFEGARIVRRAAPPDRPRPAAAPARLRGAFGAGQGGPRGRRADLHVLAGRQLDRHEPGGPTRCWRTGAARSIPTAT